jgi:amino acid transporter
VLGVGLTVGLGQAYGPLNAFSLLGLVVTLAALVVYAIVQVACIVHFRGAADVSVWRKVVFPVLAVAVICFIAYKSIVPLPPAPLSYAIWIALGWAAAGLVVVGVLSARGVLFTGLSRAVDDASEQAELVADTHA